MIIEDDDFLDYNPYPDSDRIIHAVDQLHEGVINAFAQHDYDLRASVERVNSQVHTLLWVAGMGALLISAALVWPRRRTR